MHQNSNTNTGNEDSSGNEAAAPSTAAATATDAADPTAAAAAPSSEEDNAAPSAQFEEKIINTRLSEENKENSLPTKKKLLLRGQSQVVLPVQFE